MAFLIGNAKYDAPTGALINPHFLQGPPITIQAAVASNTNLYVANNSGTIAKYDLRTGALISWNFISGVSFGYSTSLALSGNTLYIPNWHNNTIGTYDATTGAPINVNFIRFYAVLNQGCFLWGNILFVSVVGSGTLAYDATTGAPIDDYSLRFSTFGVSHNKLLAFDGGLGEYDATSKQRYAPIYAQDFTNSAVLGNNLFLQNGNTISIYDTRWAGSPIRTYTLPQSGGFIVTPLVQQSHVVTKDFNHDGYSDLVWENTATGQHVIWLLQNGGLSSAYFLPSAPVNWRIVGVADFNNDGNADLVWENTVTGQHTIWFLKNGVFSSAM
jgi:hypothetical protein